MKRIWILIVFGFLASVFSVQGINITNCTNITSSGAYLLLNDIINETTYSGCMNIQSDDITLDCQGHTIDGDGDQYGYGIKADPSFGNPMDNITIKNCNIKEFGYGIFFFGKSNAIISNTTFYNTSANNNIDDGITTSYTTINLTNITTNSNGGEGIWIYYSDDSSITQISSNSNSGYGILTHFSQNVWHNGLVSNNNKIGFYLISSRGAIVKNSVFLNNSQEDMTVEAVLDNQCEVEMTNISGTNDKPILFFNYSVNLSDWNNNISGLILCSADNSILTNITINNTNGIQLLLTEKSNLSNINVYNAYNAIKLYFGSNNNSINDSTFDNNTYGIFLFKSWYNILSNSQINHNENGLYFTSSSKNNRIYNNYIINNIISGVSLIDGGGLDPEYNHFYNNYLNNSQNIFLNDGISNEIYFNTTKNCSSGLNIIGGNCSGGNFWAHPNGTGFSENCSDVDEDGLCDNNLNLSNGTSIAYDYLPLTFSISSQSENTINITNCTNLNQSGKSYLLTKSVSYNDTCFDVTADNVTLNCQGNWINTSRYGVISTNTNTPLNNITIKNCKIYSNDTKSNIYFYKTLNVKITNNTLISNKDGIILGSTNNSLIENNSLIINSTFDVGVSLSSSNNNTINNNTIVTYQNFSYGMYLSNSDYNTISNNSINTTGVQSFGILIRTSQGNTISGNNITVVNTDEILDVSNDTTPPSITYDTISNGTNYVLSGDLWLNLSLNEYGTCMESDYYYYQTNETTAPQIYNPGPTGYFETDCTFDISFKTNERSTCKASLDTDLSFENMNITFSRYEESMTNYSFDTSISTSVGNHTVFAKCQDVAGNLMNNSYNWNFYRNTSGSGCPAGGSVGGGGSGASYYKKNYTNLYENLSSGYTYLINTTCWDIASNTKDVSFKWIVAPNFNITITYPNESILILSPWLNEYNFSGYNVTVNFTTNVPTICEEKFYGTSVSHPPSCAPAFCDDNGCSYICGGGASGGGSMYYTSLNENLTTNHSFIKTVFGNKNKHFIRCYDQYNNSVTENSSQYIPRENYLTVEWAKILRPILAINQSINFISSVTNYYNLTFVNFSLRLPNSSIIYYNYSVNIGQSVDTRFDKNFNDTPITGDYILNVSYYDINNNSVNRTLNFSVYESLIAYFNSTKGDYGFSVKIKDPTSGSTINVGNSSGGGGMKVPKANISLELEPTNSSKSKIIIPSINISRYNITPNGELINLSKITNSANSLGNGSSYRYLPLNSEALEIENYSLINLTSQIQIDYSELNISNPNKLVVFKSDYDFNSSTVDYSNGVFYKVGDSTYPLYINTSDEFIYFNVTSFSSFILGEDQATTEICGNSIDDDFDGSTDEGCSSGGNNGGSDNSPGSTGPGGSSPNSDLDRVSVILTVIDEGNETPIKITTDALGLYEAIVEVNKKVENIKFTFEKKNEKPAETTEPKSREKVFKYLEIKQDKNASDIKKIKLRFKVEKSWLDNNSIDESLIRLYRFTTDWVELKTDIDSFDKDYFYYEAETSGLSYFKIAAIKPEEQQESESQDKPAEARNTTPTLNESDKIDEKPKQTATILTLKNIIGGSLIILIMAGIIAFAMLRPKNKVPEKEGRLNKNHIKALQEFFEKAKQHNIDLYTAKKKLLEKGWKKEEIQRGFEEFRKNH